MTRTITRALRFGLLILVLAAASMTPAAGDGPQPAAPGSANTGDHPYFTETYFFGSSSTDTGNIKIRFDIPDDPPYFQGRFTNGLNWADYLAGMLGTSAAPSLAGGPNYAHGGARNGVPAFDGFVRPITEQVDTYLADVGNSADPGALHLLQLAANDLIAARSEAPDIAKQTMEDAVVFTEQMLTDLYQAGGRNFVVLNVPELPNVPPPVLPDGTNLAALFNDGLQDLVDNFQHEGVTIAVFDLHRLIADVAEDPSAFGMTVIDCSYLGDEGVFPPDPCEPTVPVEEYLLYDDVHYTTAMYSIVADRAADAIDAAFAKQYVCHTPPGNPNDTHTIWIAARAVPAHLAHGDPLGPCV